MQQNAFGSSRRERLQRSPDLLAAFKGLGQGQGTGKRQEGRG